MTNSLFWCAVPGVWSFKRPKARPKTLNAAQGPFERPPAPRNNGMKPSFDWCDPGVPKENQGTKQPEPAIQHGVAAEMATQLRLKMYFALFRYVPAGLLL